jgi:ferric-dicitrate binding protein FerR (iron transport regulator)
MSHDCDRFAELGDREAIGEALTVDESAFAAAHARSCEACGREAALYGELGALLAAEDGRAGRRAAVVPDAPPTRVPGGAEGGERGGRDRDERPAPVVAPRRLGRRTGVAAALLVAAAASVLLWMRAGPAPEPRATAPAPAAATSTPAPVSVATAATSPAPRGGACVVSLVEGDARVDGQPGRAAVELVAGAVVSTGGGRACLELSASDAAVRVCLAPSSELRVVDVASRARVLGLVRGRVAAELDPQPPGTSFSITAGEGSVTAVGTAFSVEVEDGKPAVARVSHGVVLVREPSAERRLRAHEAMRFGEPAPRALPSAEEDVDRALLRASAPSDRPGRLSLETTPGGARVRLDGVAVGVTPLDLLVAPGRHELEVDGVGAASTVGVAPGEHLARSWVLPVAPPPEPIAPPPTAARPGAGGAASLLDAARAARARGDVAEAARAYRAILGEHPGSKEASAATLSLAEIELGRGHDREALALFDRYLAGGAALALEARYGRIRALERLGRGEDAKAARASFVRDYPGSPQAEALSAEPR